VVKRTERGVEHPLLSSAKAKKDYVVFLITNQTTNYSNSFYHKTLHVSGNFFDHHQEFSTVHWALVSFMQFSDDRFQAESGCSILTLLGSGHQRLHETYQCRMYSRNILMIGKEVAPNM
jgi:hypothetical protein